MSRHVGASSFRWHNSSFMPAVGIYNDSANAQLLNMSRNGRRVRSRRKSRQLLPDLQDKLRKDDHQEVPGKRAGSLPSTSGATTRIQSANACDRAFVMTLNAYGQTDSQLSLARKILGSATCNRSLRNSTSMSGSNMTPPDVDQRIRIWDRLSVPRHIRSRSTSTVPGAPPSTEDDLSQKKRFLANAPSKSHYLYGLPMRRPTVRTFEPFLKRHHKRSTAQASSTLPPALGGIHIQLPIANHTPIK